MQMKEIGLGLLASELGRVGSGKQKGPNSSISLLTAAHLEDHDAAAIMGDRISDLPDSLLCHILSFLPTKQSVATIFLSKRWTPLWNSVLVLEFDRRSHSTDSSFVNFVTSVLNTRTAPIQKLSISLGFNDVEGCDQLCIDAWAAAAISNNVQQISLSLRHNLALPRCLLSCPTLVVLRSNVLWNDDDGVVHLPSLECLRIQVVSPVAISHIYNFLSGCPVLRKFHLVGLGLSWDSIPEYLQQRLQILNLYELRAVTIAFMHEFNQGSDTDREYWYYLFKKLCNVVYLTLSSTVMQSLVNSIHEIPTFNKLTRLAMLLQLGSFSWDSMTRLLQNCHQLENLTVLKDHLVSGEVPSWPHPQPDTTCVSPRLKTLYFEGYGGSQDELQFVRYFLKNAKNLETLKISSFRSLKEEESLRMLADISSSPTWSGRCRFFVRLTGLIKL